MGTPLPVIHQRTRNHTDITDHTDFLIRVAPVISVLLTGKFLPSWKEFPLGGFLSVLCVLAVNADRQFNRQVAKYAKKTPSKAIWLRPCRPRLFCVLMGVFQVTGPIFSHDL